MYYPTPYKRSDRGNQYFFKYTDRSGNRRQKNTECTNHRKAQKFIREFIDRYQYGSESTFRDYAKAFTSLDSNPRAIRLASEKKTFGETHQRKVKYCIETFIMPDVISNKLIADIFPGDVIDFRTRIYNLLKDTPNTAGKVFEAFKMILSEATLRGDLRVNPSQGISKINHDKKVTNVLSVKEIQKIFATPWENVMAYQVFRLTAFTGMRMGEVLALHWEQLDGHLLTIDRAWKTRTTLGTTKTSEVRVIPLPASVLDHLPPRTNKKKLIFCYPSGDRLHETWWRNNWIKVKTNVTPHSLRHSLNTNLIQAKVPITLIQIYLGWSRTALTTVQNGYFHESPEMLQEVADMIDQLYTLG